MSEKRKKLKQFFMRQKKSKRFVLEQGQKGFLCSCCNREIECIKESYNLLNKYADILYQDTSTKLQDDAKFSEQIEDKLQDEIKALKSDKSRFDAVDSGAKNVLFIKTTLDNPVELIRSIFEDLVKNKTLQTRYLIRIVPIEVVCKATTNDIKTHIEPLLNKHFVETPKTYSIVFNHRNNNCLSRKEVIDEVAKMVANKNKDNQVNLKEAELSIIIETIKGFALLAVVPDFYKFKKYNLHSVCDSNLNSACDSNLPTISF